ncbi:MAG: homocysteine S-methyltransferase family protein [Candidatus Neomarinimicrobiota bacterium]
MNKTLILDGAVGTELIKRGLKLPLPLWSARANISHPEIITKIHQDYINAGSDIITTNTFRTTSWTYKKLGYGDRTAKIKAKESLDRAINCAQNTKGAMMIAGSITTIEDCYKPEMFPGKNIAEDHYNTLINQMKSRGIKLLLFETMGNLDEIKIVLDISESKKIDVWLSLIFKNEFNLLDGSSLKKTIDLINQYNVKTLLNNCNQLNSNFNGIDYLRSNWKGKWGVYPNLGITEYGNDYFLRVDRNILTSKIRKIIIRNPDVIGLCCGSTINDIKLIKQIIEAK